MKGISLGLLRAIVLSLISVFLNSGYAGCNSSSGKSAAIEEHTEAAVLEREFKIKHGQELAVKGQDLKVKFEAVLEDSRCPAGVNCVWEGDAKILIIVRRANAPESRLELHSNRKFTQAEKYEQYVIRLVALNPSPRTGKEKLSDYVATLLVKKE